MSEDIKEIVNQYPYECKVCGFRYKEKALAEACKNWCAKYKSCNLEITEKGLPPN